MNESGAPLSPINFSTKLIRPADQFDAWSSFVGATTDVTLLGDRDRGFTTDIDAWDLGSLAFVRASMPGAGFKRRYQMRRKNPVDHWCLLLSGDNLIDGALPASATTARLKLRPLARPFDHASEDPHMLALYICRDMFANMTAAFDAKPSEVANVGLSRIVADYMVILARNIGQVTAAEMPALVEATRVLLAAWGTASPDALAEAQPAITLTQRERVCGYIRQNLAAADLSVEKICRDVGVSRSKLYRMFEDLDGVASYIRRQRLLAAFNALSNLDNASPIAGIAADFTFNDASGFGRAFRREFGLSPGDVREAALAGAPVPRLPPPSFGGSGHDLSAIVRRLQV